MSKVICIPGSTTFRPLDDIISIDIHVKLAESVEVLPPNNSTSDFMLGAKTQIKTLVVTKYAVDNKSGDEEKAYDVETKIFEIDSIDLDTNADIQLLTDSEIYINAGERAREQIDIRIDKFKEYMQYEEAQTVLSDKLDNIAPVDPEESTSSVVEEEDDPAEARTPRILENLNPDRQKLEEIVTWLGENNDKQSKRLPYLEKHFKQQNVILEADDGYVFLERLRTLSYDDDLVTQVKDVIEKTIESVSQILD